MKRRLLNLLTALSLLMCVGVVVLWVRSYFRHDVIVGYAGSVRVSCASRLGEVWVDFAADPSQVVGGRHGRKWNVAGVGDGKRWTHVAHVGGNGWRWLGFGYGTQPFPGPAAGSGPSRLLFHVMLVPCWGLFALFATIPLLRATLLTRRRRVHCALCPSCGYDLRATPGRCPECGNQIMQPSPNARAA